MDVETLRIGVLVVIFVTSARRRREKEESDHHCFLLACLFVKEELKVLPNSNRKLHDRVG